MGKYAIDLSTMGKRWPSAFVARSQVDRFSGGLLNPKYMANLDCKGLGPEGRVKIGRKVGYPVENLISWMQERAEDV